VEDCATVTSCRPLHLTLPWPREASHGVKRAAATTRASAGDRLSRRAAVRCPLLRVGLCCVVVRALAGRCARAQALLLGLALGTVGMAPAHAQHAGASREAIALGVNGGWFVLGGEEFQPTDDGAGVEVYASGHVYRAFYLGLGAHYSSHGTFLPEHLHITGLFLQPELVFPVGAQMRLRVSGRGAWVHRSITAGTTGYASSGYGIGVAGAASYDLIGPLALEVSTTFDYIALDTLFPPGDADNGTALGMHLGLRLALAGRRS
jgi:hypothetical protein